MNILTHLRNWSAILMITRAIVINLILCQSGSLILLVTKCKKLACHLKISFIKNSVNDFEIPRD